MYNNTIGSKLPFCPDKRPSLAMINIAAHNQKIEAMKLQTIKESTMIALPKPDPSTDVKNVAD